VAHASDGRGAHAATHADFLAEALKRKDGRVGGHTDGQHDAGDAGHGQAEQAEVGKQRQNAQVQHGEHGHSSRGEDAETLIEHQQVQHNQRQADGGNQHAGRQRVLAERGADHLGLRVLEADGQRAGLEHRLHGGRGKHGGCGLRGHRVRR